LIFVAFFSISYSFFHSDSANQNTADLWVFGDGSVTKKRRCEALKEQEADSQPLSNPPQLQERMVLEDEDASLFISAINELRAQSPLAPASLFAPVEISLSFGAVDAFDDVSRFPAYAAALDEDSSLTGGISDDDDVDIFMDNTDAEKKAICERCSRAMSSHLQTLLTFYDSCNPRKYPFKVRSIAMDIDEAHAQLHALGCLTDFEAQHPRLVDAVRLIGHYPKTPSSLYYTGAMSEPN